VGGHWAHSEAHFHTSYSRTNAVVAWLRYIYQRRIRKATIEFLSSSLVVSDYRYIFAQWLVDDIFVRSISVRFWVLSLSLSLLSSLLPFLFPFSANLIKTRSPRLAMIRSYPACSVEIVPVHGVGATEDVAGWPSFAGVAIFPSLSMKLADWDVTVRWPGGRQYWPCGRRASVRGFGSSREARGEGWRVAAAFGRRRTVRRGRVEIEASASRSFLGDGLH